MKMGAGKRCYTVVVRGGYVVRGDGVPSLLLAQNLLAPLWHQRREERRRLVCRGREHPRRKVVVVVAVVVKERSDLDRYRVVKGGRWRGCCCSNRAVVVTVVS